MTKPSPSSSRQETFQFFTQRQTGSFGLFPPPRFGFFLAFFRSRESACFLTWSRRDSFFRRCFPLRSSDRVSSLLSQCPPHPFPPLGIWVSFFYLPSFFHPFADILSLFLFDTISGVVITPPFPPFPLTARMRVISWGSLLPPFPSRDSYIVLPGSGFYFPPFSEYRRNPLSLSLSFSSPLALVLMCVIPPSRPERFFSDRL